jgi:hypothetical protein
MVTISIQSLLTCNFIEQIILILFNDEIEKLEAQVSLYRSPDINKSS